MEQRKTQKPQGTTPDQRLPWWEGLEAKEMFCASGRGRNIFLDIPLYRSGDYTHDGWVRLLQIMASKKVFLLGWQCRENPPFADQ